MLCKGLIASFHLALDLICLQLVTVEIPKEKLLYRVKQYSAPYTWHPLTSESYRREQASKGKSKRKM